MRIVLRLGDRRYTATGTRDAVQVEESEPMPVIVQLGGNLRVGNEPGRRAWAAAVGDTRWVFLDGQAYEFEVETQGARPRRAAAQTGSLSAPMPATVLKVQAAPGQTVKRGDTLLVLEAMKMELPVRAHADGRVTAVHCAEGDLVQPGIALIEMADP